MTLFFTILLFVIFGGAALILVLMFLTAITKFILAILNSSVEAAAKSRVRKYNRQIKRQR